jgi:hypothetical protein
MMLGIVMTILGMIMTIYVPIWARSHEINHLDDVSDSFMDLKITVDDQILTNDVGSKFSTRFSLGSSGGPFLGVGRSSGSLDFDSGKSTIRVYQTEDLLNIFGEGGGRLTFDAFNSYYIDQTLVYENGAFIVIQGGRAVMKATPDMVITNDPVTNITSLNLNVISLIGTHVSVGGNDDKMIDTVLTSDMDAPHLFDWRDSGRTYGQNITIQLTTFYPEVWETYFNDTLSAGTNPLIWDADGTGGTYDGDYYIYSQPYSGSDPVLLEARDIFINIRDVKFMDCEHAVIAVDIN